MPFDYTLDTLNKRVIIKATVNIDTVQIINIANQHLSDPLWEPGYDILVDYSEADHLDLSNVEANMIGNKLVKRADDYGNARLAFVMPQDLMFGIGRMFEAVLIKFHEAVC